MRYADGSAQGFVASISYCFHAHLMWFQRVIAAIPAVKGLLRSILCTVLLMNFCPSGTPEIVLKTGPMQLVLPHRHRIFQKFCMAKLGTGHSPPERAWQRDWAGVPSSNGFFRTLTPHPRLSQQRLPVMRKAGGRHRLPARHSGAAFNGPSGTQYRRPAAHRARSEGHRCRGRSLKEKLNLMRGMLASFAQIQRVLVHERLSGRRGTW
jgi:hypothetical protein